MKHAFLITAYNEPEKLKHELKMLDHAKVDIFIHIDKKADLSAFDFLQNICQKSHVYVVDKNIDVYWGGYSQIASEMILYNEAFRRGKYGYFHLLSGTTLPIKSIEYIDAFCEKYAGMQFISFWDKDIKNYIDRIKYRYYIDNNLYFKYRNVLQHIDALSLKIQKLLKISRSIAPLELKTGEGWCSLSYDFVGYLLSQKEFIKRNFKHSFIGVEEYKQTILWNSKFRNYVYDMSNPYKSCLHLVNWEEGSINSPSFFKWEHKDLLLSSPMLFARKFSSKDIAIVNFVCDWICQKNKVRC